MVTVYGNMVTAIIKKEKKKNQVLTCYRKRNLKPN